MNNFLPKIPKPRMKWTSSLTQSTKAHSRGDRFHVYVCLLLTFQQRLVQAQVALFMNLSKHLMEKIKLLPHKVFQKTQEDGPLIISFHEACIPLHQYQTKITPKPCRVIFLVNVDTEGKFNTSRPGGVDSRNVRLV